MSENAAQAQGVMQKEMIFKSENEGTSKKPPYRNFRVIELHDPITLDNVSFFQRDGYIIPTEGLKFKDRVIASVGMDIVYGKLQSILVGLRKA